MVVVGFLILAGAANTSIVGSNGVLNRVSEDGVLTDWFRKPHKRFGTTYRLINLIVGLQLITILLSRGDVFVLGEAYAFGVIWSFAFNAVSVLILRYKRPDAPRPWRVPLNLKFGSFELPLGLVAIAARAWRPAPSSTSSRRRSPRSPESSSRAPFSRCSSSLSGSSRNGARREATSSSITSSSKPSKEIDNDTLGCRPGGVLVPVRDYNTLAHLDWILSEQESEDRDVVALTVRVLGQGGHGTPGLGPDQMFSDYEQTLFTRVVAIAERHGRKVMLLVAPGTNIFDALAQSAVQLRSSLIVVGESEVMTPERQSILLGEAWDRTPHDPDLATRLVVLCKDKQVKRYSLGAHAPDLSSADIERIHHLWVDAVKDIGPDLHHRDVVAAALATLEDQLSGEHRQEAVDRLRRQTSHSV